MRKVTVNVTERHIRRGEPCECNTCPIALALVDMGFRRVAVGDTNASISGYHVALPAEACAFIGNFDSEIVPVAPFSFELELPD